MPLSPRRAVLQSLGFVGFLYALIYGSTALGNSNRFESPMLHVFLTGALALLAVALLVGRDPSPVSALALTRQPALKTIGFGLIGVAGVYAVNAVVTVAFLAVSGGVRARVEEKANWAFALADIPVWWVLPLTLFVGFYEEVAFRGFLLRRIEGALGPDLADPKQRAVWAAVLSGLAFGGLHGYQGVMGILQTSAVGVALGLLAVWRKSTWPGIVAHFTIDAFGLFALKVLRPMAEEVLKKVQP